jgi:hypothetical protein
MKGITVALGIMIGVPLGLYIAFEISMMPSTLRSFKLKNGELIEIISEPDRDLDHAPGLLYRISKGKTTVQGPSFFGTEGNGEHLEFQLLELREGTLVAVYERSRPDLLFLMYDLESGQLWPQSDEKSRRDGEELVERIKRLTGEDKYDYSDYTSCHFDPDWRRK